MSNNFKSPAKYVQGAGVLKELDSYLFDMGCRLLIIISESGMKIMQPQLWESEEVRF